MIEIKNLDGAVIISGDYPNIKAAVEEIIFPVPIQAHRYELKESDKECLRLWNERNLKRDSRGRWVKR